MGWPVPNPVKSKLPNKPIVLFPPGLCAGTYVGICVSSGRCHSCAFLGIAGLCSRAKTTGLPRMNRLRQTLKRFIGDTANKDRNLDKGQQGVLGETHLNTVATVAFGPGNSLNFIDKGWGWGGVTPKSVSLDSIHHLLLSISKYLWGAGGRALPKFETGGFAGAL